MRRLAYSSTARQHRSSPSAWTPHQRRASRRPDDEDTPEVAEDGFETLLPGVRYKEIARGEGPAADYKQSVTCSYTAECTKTGEVFEKVEQRTLRIGDADAARARAGIETAARGHAAASKRRRSRRRGRPAGVIVDGTKAIEPRTDVTWRSPP